MELVKVFSEDKNYQIVPTDLEEMDITNKKEVFGVFEKEKPDLVIHCAAWTDVDGCAKDPKKAMFFNGEGTKNVSSASKEIAAKTVYISTNEVFDGKKKTPYVEDDQPKPINPYAESKLAGEKYCQEILGDKCIIIRSSWLYGPASKNNFPQKIIKRAKEFEELEVTSDEIANPTFTPDLAKALKKLVDKDISGIFHLVNNGFCSRYEWAKEIFTLSGLINVNISPIKLSDWPRLSTPPLFGALSNKNGAMINIELRDWRDALKEYFKLV
ncbi:MAG: dTDP-4-dehydrorhamnose reductase [Candidatus Woykebacteria bacterium RBG_13_40_7b]|uniref:dTDP-4-dehydrorhamnose reductase n=1 Tax=Candidatus Woykebacteria bacterium RBG_13_40_7b TaxID=1802594 RepID=A0A1G1W770_9BACT|nr:MAG: dTDP-4-dehydrorhamnose reductase [Candidatus Woykebacteria bacterium RBG_13_40_7b]